MNKRIHELAKQAGLLTGWSVGQVEFQSFAELIINDCIKLIGEENLKVSENWQCKDGVHITWKVREHFGVFAK